MALRDLNSERLYVEAPLAAGVHVAVNEEQAHYLTNVLRMATGSTLLVFNGRDGEWRATIAATKKRAATLTIESQTRPQTSAQDLDYLFAPLKRSRLDYMIQKAVEMGVSQLRPIMTRYTIAERVNLNRMRANAIEAAEQCGVLAVPEVLPPQDFDAVLKSWDIARTLIFCDEDAVSANPIDVLSKLKPGPLAVIIGPEGGFSEAERDALLGQPFVKRVSLGPRVMRADTAAVAALSLVNATLGDWR